MKKIIFPLLSICLFSAAQAQTVNAELKSLIEKAFSYSPQIQDAEEAIHTGELRTDLAKTGYIPSLNANATYTYMAPVAVAQIPTGPSTFQEIRFQPNNNYNANLSLNYVMYDFGRLQATIKKTKNELALNNDNLGIQQTLLASQISQYYYAFIYLQKSLAIEDSLIRVLEENKKLTESKLKNGDAIKLDVLSIQSSLDMEIMRKTELITTLEKQKIFIAYFTGVQDFLPQSQQFDFRYNNREETKLVDQAKNQNFEYMAAQHRLEVSRTDIQFSKRQFLPYLNLNASTGFKNGYMPNVNEMRFNYMAGVGVAIPILDAIKTTQQIKIGKSILKQQEWKVQNLENGLNRDIRLAVAEIKLQEDKLVLSQGQIEAAKEALRIANTRYNNGTSTYLELINAAYNLQKVQLQQLQIEYNLCLANIELARVSGTKFYQ